jgi:hypothetical protein
MKLLAQHLLTENEVVDSLISYLRVRGWKIESHCKGYEKGTDIVATKSHLRAHIEAKGAKANKSIRRKSFDRNQIRSHLGVAILKTLKLKAMYPQDIHIIAQPHTEEIM